MTMVAFVIIRHGSRSLFLPSFRVIVSFDFCSRSSSLLLEEIEPLARGLRVMQVKTIGRSRGGHSCEPNPYSSWLSNVKALKLVKAVAGLEK
jgi:hypothetical protein